MSERSPLDDKEQLSEIMRQERPTQRTRNSSTRKTESSLAVPTIASILQQQSTELAARDRAGESLQPANGEFLACMAPDVRTPPQFVVPYRQPFPVFPFTFSEDDNDPHRFPSSITLACTKVSGYCHLGVDFRFEQTWNLLRLNIGDLSSTMSLAPSEELRLEFLSSQRRVLSQTTVDQAEEMVSTESTTLDKEAVNVARAASRTENWRVDGSGKFSLGDYAVLNFGGGTSASATTSAQSSVDRISEATTKSARSLKTLHKIEVSGVTEGFVQNRMTRVLKNPYVDRTLSINVFQLVKHFSVETRLAELVPILVIDIDDIVFDNDFIVSNVDFLRGFLLDLSLVDELGAALRGAKPPASPTLERATMLAKLALQVLYEHPNIFDVPTLAIPGGANPVDANSVALSLNATPDATAPSPEQGWDYSGLKISLTQNAAVVFTTLNFFYKVYKDMQSNNTLEDNAIDLATALEAYLNAKWPGDLTAFQIQNILDIEQLSEIMRRLSGFLALVGGTLKPLVPDTVEELKAVEEQTAAAATLQRLIEHLSCHRNYYIEQFLTYTATRTGNQAIVDFVHKLINNAVAMPDLLATVDESVIQSAFDAERAFVDGRQIIVPWFDPNGTEVAGMILVESDEASTFDSQVVIPAVAEVEVPCDGIHLEAAAGGCVLPDVPNLTTSVELILNEASLKASAPA